jgi:hypothetical protein
MKREHAKNPTSTKLGPGRYHRQGGNGLLRTDRKLGFGELLMAAWAMRRARTMHPEVHA